VDDPEPDRWIQPKRKSTPKLPWKRNPAALSDGKPPYFRLRQLSLCFIKRELSGLKSDKLSGSKLKLDSESDLKSELGINIKLKLKLDLKLWSNLVSWSDLESELRSD
jgi:hypothetical protein